MVAGRGVRKVIRLAVAFATVPAMRARLAGALLAASAALGCAGLPVVPPGILSPAGTPSGGTLLLTTTELSQGNYRVIRSGVRGQSQGLVLLLFLGLRSASLTDAVDRLYEAAGLERGGPWALAHVVHEYQPRSFLLFGLPRMRVRADVVEFVGVEVPDRPAPGCSDSGSLEPAGAADRGTPP